MKKYLANTDAIDWQNPQVLGKAESLAKNCRTELEIAKKCFEFVRDEIKHSWDFKMNPVTWKASEVLQYATGYCYAKSHLLAALLRANGIPAGLCYQRLTITNDQPPFCLHGLNAIFLPEFGWYKVDARGNKVGVNAQFTPPLEQLAFEIKTTGEWDFSDIYAEPLEEVLTVLKQSQDFQQVADNLPDIKST